MTYMNRNMPRLSVRKILSRDSGFAKVKEVAKKRSKVKSQKVFIIGKS